MTLSAALLGCSTEEKKDLYQASNWNLCVFCHRIKKQNKKNAHDFPAKALSDETASETQQKSPQGKQVKTGCDQKSKSVLFSVACQQ